TPKPLAPAAVQLILILMSLETFLLWIAIGLVSGWLASMVVGGGYGVIGDIVVGIIGSFLGGWPLRELGFGVHFRGGAGQIVLAFIGAVVLLLLLRLAHRIMYRRG